MSSEKARDLNSSMTSVVSRDGTTLAVERIGTGPALVLVDGALCTRAQGPGKSLAPFLSEQFTVYTYDRRGRGGSGDTAETALHPLERDLEDLAAVISEAGDMSDMKGVFGHSSGAVIALEAARAGLAVKRLALYEAPFVVDDSRPPVGDDLLPRVQAAIAADGRGAAIKLFMREVVRVRNHPLRHAADADVARSQDDRSHAPV
jgi:pimeloyl-ACP methyl ester carboxylesterase